MKKNKLLKLSIESIRLLTTGDLKEAVGGSAISPSILGSACWGACPSFYLTCRPTCESC